MSAATVAAIYIYPVKSLRGQSVPAAKITERGFRHDRLWMIVDGNGLFITQRTHPSMCLVSASVEDDVLTLSAASASDLTLPIDGAQGEPMDVTVWQHTAKAIDQGDDAAEWLERILHFRCRLARMDNDHVRQVKQSEAQVGFADAYPFLVVSEASLADLNRRLETPLPMNRFRPNIVVGGVEAYAEDTWDSIQIAGTTLFGATRCERCAVTTTNQDTAERSTEPLRTLATYRRTNEGSVVFGRNFVHEAPGALFAVGDAIVDVEPRPTTTDRPTAQTTEL